MTKKFPEDNFFEVQERGIAFLGAHAQESTFPAIQEEPCQQRWGDRVESLNPRAVVAGHKIPENADDPRIIAETRQYLRDFNRLDEATTTVRELYDAMLELYPDRANPGSLWGGAKAVKQQATSSSQ